MLLSPAGAKNKQWVTGYRDITRDPLQSETNHCREIDEYRSLSEVEALQ